MDNGMQSLDQRQGSSKRVIILSVITGTGKRSRCFTKRPPSSPSTGTAGPRKNTGKENTGARRSGSASRRNIGKTPKRT